MVPVTDPGDVDVDARFVLANERTLLAWVRTSLTFVAGGVAVQLTADADDRRLLSVLLLLVAVATVLTGAVRYAAADRAVRAGEVPATGRAPYALVALVTGVALAAVAVVVLGAR